MTAFFSELLVMMMAKREKWNKVVAPTDGYILRRIGVH